MSPMADAILGEREEKWAQAGVLRLEHGSQGAALVKAGQMPFEVTA